MLLGLNCQPRKQTQLDTRTQMQMARSAQVVRASRSRASVSLDRVPPTFAHYQVTKGMYPRRKADWGLYGPEYIVHHQPASQLMLSQVKSTCTELKRSTLDKTSVTIE